MSEMVSEALHSVLSYFKSSGGIMATGNRWPEQRYTYTHYTEKMEDESESNRAS